MCEDCLMTVYSTRELADKGAIYLGLGRMLMIGPQWDSGIHQHAVIQLLLSMKHPFFVRTENSDWIRTKAVIINSNMRHEMKDFRGSFVSVTIVPERRRGVHLQKYVLKGVGIKFLDYKKIPHFMDQFRKCVEANCDCSVAFHICENLIDSLTGVRGFKGNLDERIFNIMDWIQNNLSEPISAKKLAEIISLSEDRFLHFFKEQLGLPLRQYVLYQRTLAATKEFLSGKSLTEAALEAGFSDSAHFTRTFIEMNGMKPSQVAKYKEIFRISHCSSAYCIRFAKSGEEEYEKVCPQCRTV